MDSSGIFIGVALVVGIALGYIARRIQASYQIQSAEGRVSKMLEDAKNKQKELILAAKTQALEIAESTKKQENEFRSQIIKVEQRMERKEIDLDKKSEDLEQRRNKLSEKVEELKTREAEIEKIRAEQVTKLEQVAAMTREQAALQLTASIERTVGEDMTDLVRKLVAKAHEEADKEAREIVASAIERCSSEVATETTTTYVQLPSEEMKCRIIGKEGRNIKAFEQMLGVEVIVDDTPDTVVISGFNSIRRQIAKLTLEKLIKDGRIH